MDDVLSMRWMRFVCGQMIFLQCSGVEFIYLFYFSLQRNICLNKKRKKTPILECPPILQVEILGCFAEESSITEYIIMCSMVSLVFVNVTNPKNSTIPLAWLDGYSKSKYQFILNAHNASHKLCLYSFPFLSASYFCSC